MIKTRSSKSFKFTLRTLLFATTIGALVISSWRLGTYWSNAYSSNLLAYIIVCQSGAAIGFILAMRKRRKFSVIRATIGGAVGGGVALLGSILLLTGAWRVYVSLDDISDDPWMATYFLLFWLLVGCACGGIIGMSTSLLLFVFYPAGSRKSD